MSAIVQKRTIPAMGGLAAEALTYGYTPTRLPDTLQGLTGIVQNTDYLPAGEHTRTTLGVSSTADWTEINYAYEDGTQRLARQTVVSETHTGTDADIHYRYDKAGNPTEIDDRSISPGDKQCFAYDGHRRLKTAWTTAGDCATAPATGTVGGRAPYWQSFTYDSAGNRKTATNHLATGGPGQHSHQPGLRHADHRQLHLLGERSHQDSQPQRHHTDPRLERGRRTGEGHGTASLQIDAATQALTRRPTKPFGEDRGAAKPATWRGEKGFVGGTEDPTGLTHLGSREYDTTTGRFISVDPIGDLKDPQQINGYLLRRDIECGQCELRPRRQCRLDVLQLLRWILHTRFVPQRRAEESRETRKLERRTGPTESSTSSSRAQKGSPK
ncbi:RHS repeat domain-containing protein [Streptomyces shenzhenensis]|uniref:RHS repeat domain-containing protein n=1 Tax=Streptomyces shenzhenensis TaxID=943815 RepID=UPI0036B63BA8